MSPTFSVDTVLLQHLLNFWDERGIGINPVWPELCLGSGAPLPPRVATDKLGQLLDTLCKREADPLLVVRSGLYLAGRPLPVNRLLHYSDSLQHGLSSIRDLFCMQAGGVLLHLDETAAGDALVTLYSVSGAESARWQSLLLAWITAAVVRESAAASGLLLQVPANASGWQQLLGIPVDGGTPAQLQIPAQVWRALLPGRNTLLFASTRRELERQQKKLDDVTELYQELQQIVQSCLEQRVITQEAVADQVGLSVRNLQRRLKVLGTTYQALLDDSRRAMAMRMMQNPDIPLYEVALLVGYAEPSAFYKAFRRWTGSTPGEYRQALMEPETETGE